MAKLVEIQGLDKLLNKLSALPGTLQREVGRELRDSSDIIVRNAKRGAPKDEGQLARGISRADKGSLDYEIISAAGYSAYMEFGTKTKFSAPSELQEFAAQFKTRGPKIGFDAFFLIILDWVKRKGIAGRFSVKTKKRLGNKNQQLQEDFNAAWAISLSILRKGVTPHPFFFDPYFNERPKLLKKIETVLNDAVKV